jgi:membrane-bound ClpP family serine protease
MGLIITLIILGTILLLIELLIIPGFGVTGILGILSLVGGVVMAYYNHGNGVGHLTLASAVVICGVLTGFALRPKTWKRLSLNENITAQAITTAEERGLSVGMQGVSITRLAPMGTVKINHTQTEAVTFDGIINPAQKVEIVKIEGAKVIVKTVASPAKEAQA